MNEMSLIPENLIIALGSSLLHSIWQGLIIGAILFITLRLIPRSNAHLKYWMSITALTAIVVWTGLTFKEQLFQTLNTVSTVPLAADQAIMPVTLSDSTGHYLGDFKNIFSQVIDAWIPYMPYIVIVWLVGACILLVRLQGSLMYLNRLKVKGISPLDLSWQWKIKAMCRDMGIKRQVALFESTLTKVPMVIGHLKPFILLPVGMVSGLPVSEVEAILAHELAHVKRYDYLINIFQTIVESVLFFNPLVWWISAKIRTQREHCCDDLAVLYCGNHITYAHALTNLGEWTTPDSRYSMALFKSRKELLNRIKRLIRPQSRWSVKNRWTPALILTLGLLCLGWYSLKVQAQFKDQAPVEAPVVEAQESMPIVLPDPIVVPDEVVEPWYEEAPEPTVVPDTVPVPHEDPMPTMEPWVESEIDEDFDFGMESFDWPAPDFDLNLHVDVLRDIDIPDLPVMADIEHMSVFPDQMDFQQWFHFGDQLNDTTKKKIEAALQEQREALEQAKKVHDEALRQAQQQLRQSLNEGRPEDLTEEEWEMAKQQIRRAERALERTMERTEQELEKAIDQREIEAQLEDVHRHLRESHREFRNRERDMERARQHLDIARKHEHRWEGPRGQRHESALREMLFSDGLIDSRGSDINLVFKKDLIRINGKKLDGELKTKYRRLFDDFYGQNSEGSLSFEED